MKKRLLLLAVLPLLLASCGETTPSQPQDNEPQQGDKTPSDNPGDDQQPTGGDDGGQTVQVQYTITFKDENGQVLESKKWNEGAIPSYTYNKQDTAEWDYTVQGWASSLNGEVITIPAASADATYWAVVTKVKQQYTIAFFDENGTQLQSNSLEYGAQPSCSYTGPSDSAEWDYTFTGWSLTLGGTALSSIPTVSANANYYAAVSKNKQRYSVNFYDENGTLLETVTYAYGETPSYTYTKQDTQEWDYTVLGWATSIDGEVVSTLPAVTENTSYYIRINAVKQKYTITFIPNGGSQTASITEDYGTQIQEPTKPTRSEHKFTGWSYDADGEQKVTWPLTLTKNETLYANWNQVVNIKEYLQALMGALEQDPYSYVPAAMLPDYSDNHVTAAAVNYDFTNFTNVNSIKYGGHGEQWHMVLENLKESERFYAILTLSETIINSSVVLFNNYLDNNPSDTASHSLNETEYTAKLTFDGSELAYTIQYKTGLTIPFFGEVLPQIDMTFNITSLEKTVRVQLSENNAMKYIVTDSNYKFYLKYGVDAVSRTACCELSRLTETIVEGQIAEYVQFKDKDLVPALVSFYINSNYTTVVGNKASGMPGFSGYINELYNTSEGKLLGYKVRETFTKWSITATYHTLWFNLNNITGISNVKAIKNEESTYGLGANNAHDIYLNNSASIFEPTYNKKAFVKTSRKYDVELRKQYFYSYDGESNIVEYETQIPMMFIQDNHDDYTNYNDFEDDMENNSGIIASVNLSSTYLNKIRSDYDYYIDVFIENEDMFPSSFIEYKIGDATVI